jgi:NAD(P)H-dependent flavin oxidoreductase YrpB (nitropropane dioxygenase family)
MGASIFGNAKQEVPRMRTEFTKQLGLEVPIFAFTHSRDVVVAVSKAGGIGVLGAVGYSPEQLKQELDWIDKHIGDQIYGVDTAIPQKYEGQDETDPAELVAMIEAAIPAQHREFVDKLLADHGVTRPKCRMIVNALGTPPAQRELYMNATSKDTVRTRSISGKPGRIMKNAWTDAWERPDTPDPLPMPLQGYLTFAATRRTNRYVGVGDTKKVAFAPVGQVVGQINEIETCRDIMERLMTEHGEACERIQSLMPE